MKKGNFYDPKICVLYKKALYLQPIKKMSSHIYDVTSTKIQ